MGSYRSVIFFVISVTCILLVTAQQTRRCFQFTWLGPRYDNESVFMNSTCSDATKLAQGVPCFTPLVVSYDGSWPDIEYIWRNHFEEATCLLADNDVCAQYTYYFNGVAENSTYMCTKAVDNMNNAITNGCYEDRNGSWSTRVCFCRSIPGGVPCNSGVSVTLATGVIMISFTVYIINMN